MNKEELTLLAEVQMMLNPDNIATFAVYIPPAQQLRNEADKMDRDNATRKRFDEFIEAKEKEFIDTKLVK
jgi:tRNA A58 N-methylase Trm61